MKLPVCFRLYVLVVSLRASLSPALVRAYDFANLQPKHVAEIHNVIATATVMPLRRRQYNDERNVQHDVDGEEEIDRTAVDEQRWLQNEHLPSPSSFATQIPTKVHSHWLAHSIVEHAWAAHHHCHHPSHHAPWKPAPVSEASTHMPLQQPQCSFNTTREGLPRPERARWASLLPREAVQYNVSSLGSPDALAKQSTVLDYDHNVKIEEHHRVGDDVEHGEGDATAGGSSPPKNGKGSIETRVNGTIEGIGSVGAVVSVGWHGNGKAKASFPDASTPFNLARDDSITPRASTTSDGLSAMWLAFTSRDAITGGYLLHGDSATASNNIVFANVTVRTNVTIDADGRLSITVIVGDTGETEHGEEHADARTVNATLTNDTTRPSRRAKQIICSQSSSEGDLYGSEAAAVVRCHRKMQ